MENVELVTFMREHDGVTPEDASAQLGVSTRTLRKYVARANESLSGAAVVELIRGEGYRLRVLDQEGLDAWIAAQGGGHACLACKTSEERVNYLLNDLLMRNDWIKLQELSQALFVSKSALSGDLKKVEERLRPYDLVLEKRSHYGIRVTGGEMSRRLCLANAAIDASSATGASGVTGGLNTLVLKNFVGGGASKITRRCSTPSPSA